MLEVSDSWRSGIKSWRHTGGKKLEPVYGSENTENPVKINNSPRFIAKRGR